MFQIWLMSINWTAIFVALLAVGVFVYLVKKDAVTDIRINVWVLISVITIILMMVAPMFKNDLTTVSNLVSLVLGGFLASMKDLVTGVKPSSSSAPVCKYNGCQK